MNVANPKNASLDKGGRYVVQLDQGLCNGKWADVPELARKVEKHAPDRRCLTLAARTQGQIVSASHRPASAGSNASASVQGLSDLIPKLKEAAEAATPTHPDDAKLAFSCIAEIYWLQHDHRAALQTVHDAAVPERPSSDGPTPLGWIEVCAVKSVFIKAACLETTGREDGARVFYEPMLKSAPGTRSPELRRWTERLLARACMLSISKGTPQSQNDLTFAFNAFRAWGDFWQRAPPTATGTSELTRADVPRRDVWRAYYALLSDVLQRGLLLNPTSKILSSPLISHPEALPLDQLIAAKRQQRAEVKRIESTYESLVLNETKFPKASQTNAEAEEMAEQVLKNWKVFTGPEWSDAELGDGGKEMVSRGVLDILYRAATKTFHSTAILRQLFAVHSALGEYDLAMHAFESYSEIFDGGKARAQKTGKHETGFDTDDEAIQTAAEAVRVCCRYGTREQVEKAVKIGETIKKWLVQRPTSSHGVATNGDQSTAAAISLKALSAAYWAIGISGAHWAYATYENEIRSSLLADARDNLRRALNYDQANITTAYALALVLIEMRDISAALEVAKGAVAASRNPGEELPAFERQRQLLPIWHVLALCLTAKDEYTGASRMCEAAFKQFGEPAALFGSPPTQDPEKDTAGQAGLVDQMDGFEKETIVQIKMSQIMLAEIMEGAEEAVDMTDELLSLYARLFGNPELAASPKLPPAPRAAIPISSTPASPSKIGGTLKSIAGSIKPKHGRGHANKDVTNKRSMASLGIDAQQGQANGHNAAITSAANEDAAPPRKARERPSLPQLSFRGRTADNKELESGLISPGGIDTSEAPIQAALDSSAQSKALAPDQPPASIPHNRPYESMPAPQAHDHQPPQQDTRLPAPHPAAAVGSAPASAPQFTTIHERRHRVTLLLKVWLFIAGLYVRAESWDDAQNALNEATKLTGSMETQLGNEQGGSTAKKLFAKGWGGGKGVDELWADVWAMKGRLARARELPFDAITNYEQALSYYPDHPEGIIGISELLMDIYEEKLAAEASRPSIQPATSQSSTLLADASSNVSSDSPSTAAVAPQPGQSILGIVASEMKNSATEPSPAELNRVAARDRAYMLLSNLTKLSTGWDNSEAWFTLARAHELSKQVGKAKQALWWVVELEDNRPMRNWHNVMPGGYAL